MKLIQNNNLTVLLRYNHHEFLVTANCETLLVIESQTNNLIDTLIGHSGSITGVDSSFDGIIVSISKVEVCFFVPTSPLKWNLSFKSQMQGGLIPTAVKISTIADMCILAGDRFVSIWTQDVSHDWKETSYTQQIFYSQSSQMHAGQMGQVLETNTDLRGVVRQVDITGDGRMLFTLEEKSKHVKIWSQNRIRDSSTATVRMFLFQELEVNTTKESNSGNLVAFRMKYKSPHSLAIEPAALLTLSQQQVCIHVESLMDPEMRFICLQSIKINSRIDTFDAQFVVMEEQFPLQLSSNPVLPHHLSKIFDTHRDEELKFKKRLINNKYGAIPTFCERSSGLLLGYGETKFDYFIVSEHQQQKVSLVLYRCKGMSNVPMRTPLIEPFKKVSAALDLSFNNIIWASCYPNLLRSTPQHDLIRFIVTNERGNIFNADYDVKQSTLVLTSSYALFSNTKTIELGVAHPDLCLMALVFDDQVVLYSDSSLYGTYNTTGVVSLQWVPNKNQFLILRKTIEKTLEVELVESGLSDFKNAQKLGLQIDIYKRLIRVQVSSATIGMVISGFSESEGAKLHFSLLNQDGSTSSNCFQISEESGNPQIQHYDLGNSIPFQDNHLVLNLITHNFSNQNGYLLIQSESQIKSRTGKAVNYIRLLKIDSEIDRVDEVFKQEVDVNHKVQSKMSQNIALISLVEGDFSKHKHVLYIYNFTDNQYLGYIKVSDVLGLQVQEGRKICPIDFSINKKADKLTIVAECKAHLLVKQFGSWVLAQKIEIFSYQPSTLNILDKYIIIDNQSIREMPKFNYQFVGSYPIFHPNLLKMLYFKGYPKQVAQILGELYLHLQDSKFPLPDINHLKFVEEVKVTSKKPFNMFGDLEESSSDSENIQEHDDKKEVQDPITLFNQESDDIITKIIHSEETLQFTSQEKLELIEFIYKFRAIYQIDFYADKLAVQLLNKVYYETEKISQSDIAYAKSLLGLSTETIAREQPAAKPFSMEELINQRMMGAHKSQADVSGIKDWSSRMVSLALHSENQDVILDQLSQRLDFQSNLTWTLMRRLGMPLWIKSDFKLKQMIEIVAKNEYRLYEAEGGNQQSQTKAEFAALWYVLSNKVSVLRQLFNVELGGKKFAEFLESDFSQPKPKTIAGKNALALVAKRKNLLACSFFLLAQDLIGAVQVALERCQDPILSVLMCRIQDPNNEQKQLDLIAEKYFIERGQLFNDSYLRSIGQWLKREYVKSVNQLEPTSISSVEHIFQSVVEFDLCQDLNLDKNFVKKNQTETQMYPLVAQISYESLDLLVRLKKVPEVKRLLNKDWQLDKKAKKGGSIFDDFLGQGSSSEEEQQQQETITVQEDLLFETLIKNLLEQGYSQIALLLIQERADLNEKISTNVKEQIASTIIQDSCRNRIFEPSQITDRIGKLQSQLKVNIKNSTVTECLSSLGLFIAEMNYLLENQNGTPIDIFDRIDKQSSSVIEFIRKSSLYSSRFFTSKLELADQRSTEQLLVVQNIEEILDVLILFDNQPTVLRKSEPQKANKAQVNTQNFFDESDDEIQPEAVPNAPLTNKMTNSSKLIASDGSKISIIELLGTLSFKCKIGVTLATAVYQLCISTSKISLLTEVVAQLIQFLSVWNWSSATVTEALIKQNIEKLSFQALKTLVQRVKISVQKQIERQTSKIDRKEAQQVYKFTQDWLRYVACFGTMDQVLSNALRILGNTKQQNQQQQITIKSRNEIQSDNKQDFTPPDLIQILDQQNRLFDQRSQIQFEFQLNLQQKRLFLYALNQFISPKPVDTNPKTLIDFRLIIKSQAKFREFVKTFNLQKQQGVLEDMCLSSRQYQQAVSAEQIEEDTLKNGIELFKHKGEAITDFQVKGDTLVLAMQQKGMREINIGTSLLYRNRSNNMDLLDEELFSWYDCLHRFDSYSSVQVEPKLEAVRQALLVHQSKKSFLNSVKQRQNQIITNKEQNNTEFDGVPVTEYLKQLSNLDITHEDFTNAVAIHQKLPIYLTGNAKGLICLWQIGQAQDRSFYQYVCEPEIRPQDLSSKKQTIQKIEFTQQGDKFAALNMEGSLFIFSFEPGNKNVPIAQKKGLKLSDFSFLDGEGTTVLAFSQSNKTLMIVDLLTGQTLNQSKVAGTEMLYDQVRQNIYTFNNKSGFIHRHDINLQQNLTKQIGKEDITSSLQFGHFGKYLAVGFSDGILKIFSLIDGDFDQPKQQINVFTSVNGKKGPVTSLRFSAETGALYAGTTLGCVKLVKVIV